jgi:DNA invertase Pin-like site-specific DNA recombinase
VGAVLSTPEKIERSHLERLAIVYLRQSSPRQVRENVRSTERQYALADRAAELGWEPGRILTVDGDLGVSGRDTNRRDSYKQLVGRVCQSEVGAIFGLEIARLARNNAELLRLLEFCALTDTLVVDTDGIYDLQDFNDRMILGLKAQWSEAELHIMASRLQGAKRAAAERGELRLPLPVGYLYDEDGHVIIDPDEEVHAAVADLFKAFAQTGSAYGVVGQFTDRRFPKRAWGGAWAGELSWDRLTYSRACDVLTNPCYAGAYVFGRQRSRRAVRPDGTIVTKTITVPRSEWAVLIQDHHPGYITWEQFLANERRLAGNHTRNGQRPAREGPALCQGIMRCASCGHTMGTQYQRGSAEYRCSRSRAEHLLTAGCRQVKAQVVDELVAERLLAALQPHEIALALAAADDVQARRERSNRALELRVERARYDAIRAERAFHACDPENRLVARSLESRWEEKLRELKDAEAELAEHTASAPEPSREQIEALARNVPALWTATTTTDKDRKRLLRTMISDVTLTFGPDSDQLQVGIRWRSGATEQHTINRPQRDTIAAATLELIARLAEDHSNSEIAAELQAAGVHTPRGRPFDPGNVSSVRCRYKIPSGPSRRDGELTPGEIAQRLEVSRGAVYYWIRHGQLQARRGAAGRLSIPFGPDIEQELRQRIANSGHFKTQTRRTGGAV